MPMIRFVCVFALTVAAVFWPTATHAQLGGNFGNRQPVTARLAADTSAVVAATPFTAAVVFEIAPDYHIYWHQPGGEAGIATKVAWELPEGFAAGPLQWQAPIRFETPAGETPIVTFGYGEGEVALLAAITPPVELAPGTTVELKATVTWQACDATTCLMPVRRTLTLSLPTAAAPPPADPEADAWFAAARAKLPAMPPGWAPSASADADRLTLRLATPPGAAHEPGALVFFPAAADSPFPAEATLAATATDTGWTVQLPLKPGGRPPARLTGVLRAEHGWTADGMPVALAIDLPLGATASAQRPSLPLPSLPTDNPAFALFVNVLFAFLGGLILNLMPCVLPVLSLKVMDFVKQASGDHGKPWQHGAVFTVGVLLSFWAMALAIILLKRAGNEVGWGFQLGEPRFVFTVLAVIFVFGLSMLGVFEIGMGLTGVGGEVSRKSGFAGSFFSGVLATVVATPCMAPFMGSAMAYALAQPPAIILVVFTSLGAGMAVPYLVLSASPALLRYVPRPGAWMETFKQLLGFALMGAVGWLLYVLAGQLGGDGVVTVAWTMLAMAVGAWTLGRFAAPVRPKGTRVVARLVALALVAGALVYGFRAMPAHMQQQREVRKALLTIEATEKGGIAWQPFEQAAIDRYRREGRPVFVDFTARWCVSCLANEKVAFTDAFAARLKELNVVPMKADLTSPDPVLEAALRQYGAVGVPLYLLFPADPAAPPIVLPQLLTEGIVMNALDKLGE